MLVSAIEKKAETMSRQIRATICNQSGIDSKGAVSLDVADRGCDGPGATVMADMPVGVESNRSGRAVAGPGSSGADAEWVAMLPAPREPPMTHDTATPLPCAPLPPGFPSSFFEPLDELKFQPTIATVGPWSSELQHGGPPIALLAHALRCHPCERPMQIARLTVEFLGPVPLTPCELQVEVVRPGRRIELLRGTMRAAGRPVLLAHAWRLEAIPGVCPEVADDERPPSRPEPHPVASFPGIAPFPYRDALDWRYVEGGMDRLGPATVWGRLRIPLIAGQDTDGLEALLAMLDSANGVSAELDIRKWSFVPVDLTLNVNRHPVGEWFCMNARTVIAGNGIGTANTRVYDDQGPLGRSQHTLFVRPR